jgi:hypothetical protein
MESGVSSVDRDMALQSSGYVKIPGKGIMRGQIALDFTPQVTNDPQGMRRGCFSIRMFPVPLKQGEQRPEIGIRFTAEQWLDLIEQMQHPFNSSEDLRKRLDNPSDQT